MSYFSLQINNDYKSLEEQICISNQNISKFKIELEHNKELLDEINSRLEYEKYKLDLIIFKENLFKYK